MRGFTRRVRLRQAQAAPLVRPDGAIDPGPTDQIQAPPEYVTKHVASLWECTHRQLALDVGRDPRDTNVAIVRLVADMKLAQATRRATLAAWCTVTVTAVGVLIAVFIR